MVTFLYAVEPLWIGESVAKLRDLAVRTNEAYNNVGVCGLCENPALLFIHIDDKKALEYPKVLEQAGFDVDFNFIHRLAHTPSRKNIYHFVNTL